MSHECHRQWELKFGSSVCLVLGTRVISSPMLISSSPGSGWAPALWEAVGWWKTGQWSVPWWNPSCCSSLSMSGQHIPDLLCLSCFRTNLFFSPIFTCGFPLCLDISVCFWESLVQTQLFSLMSCQGWGPSKHQPCFNIWVAAGFSPNTINY